jgi:predicted site-specific integrase-resolvase
MTDIDARTALTRVPTKMAETLLGATAQTLRTWHAKGKIKATRTASGRWLWDVAGYMEKDGRGLGKGGVR